MLAHDAAINVLKSFLGDFTGRPSFVRTAIGAGGGKLLIAVVLVLLLGSMALLLARNVKSRVRLKILFASPSRNQILPIGPYPVRLLFDRPIDRERSRLTLRGPNTRFEFVTIGAMGAIDVVSALLLLQDAGDYLLRWDAVSVDGVRGTATIPFTVALPQPVQVPQDR
jgi:hypothetical protein